MSSEKERDAERDARNPYVTRQSGGPLSLKYARDTERDAQTSYVPFRCDVQSVDRARRQLARGGPSCSRTW